MKLICLTDNAVLSHSPFWGEHGLAFLVESADGRVLFDTGASGTVLMHNLEVAGVAPETIAALAISHGHHDHTGGLAKFLEQRQGLPLYANLDLLRERFSQREGKMRSVGIPLAPEKLRHLADLRLSAEPQQILPDIWTSGEITERPEPEGRSAHHFVRGKKGLEPDPYRDDMALVLETERGLVLLCGCCHAGLLNTLAHVEQTFRRSVVAIIGGTHLISADANHLERVRQKMLEMESVRHIYLNHCSGETAFFTLLTALEPEVVHSCPAGTQIDLEELQ